MKRLHISSVIVIGAAATLFSVVAPASPAPEAAPSAPSKEFACSKDKSCPMQKWMKANLGAALASEDFDGLAKGLEYVAGHAPAGYPEWKKIATQGAEAAKKKDMAGVKKSCDGCHKEPLKYRDKYKDENRDAPFG
jgi:hypothetical protein